MVTALSEAVSPRLYAPLDIIYQKDDPATSFFFLVRGQIILKNVMKNVKNSDKTTDQNHGKNQDQKQGQLLQENHTLGKGSVFGMVETTLMNKTKITRRAETAQSELYSYTFELLKTDLIAITSRFK